MCRVRRLASLKCAVLTMGAFCWTDRFGIVQQYSRARTRYENDRIGDIDPLGSRYLTLGLSVGLFWLIKEDEVDPMFRLCALSRAYGIDFDLASRTALCTFSGDSRI